MASSALELKLIQLIEELHAVIDTTNDKLSVGIEAGSNIVGSVGIDQTTPGTTNAVVQIGTTVKAAGKKTDPDGTDRTITPTGGFEKICIINDGPAELRICIDANSTTLTNNIIYVKDSEVFEDYLPGSAIHYSIANDSCTFRYVLV